MRIALVACCKRKLNRKPDRESPASPTPRELRHAGVQHGDRVVSAFGGEGQIRGRCGDLGS
jgi:hypothetical protein